MEKHIEWISTSVLNSTVNLTNSDLNEQQREYE